MGWRQGGRLRRPARGGDRRSSVTRCTSSPRTRRAHRCARRSTASSIVRARYGPDALERVGYTGALREPHARDLARAADASAVHRATLGRRRARGCGTSARRSARALVDARRMDREQDRRTVCRHLPWHRCATAGGSVWRALARPVMRRASAVTTASEFLARDLARFLPEVAGKVSVTSMPHGHRDVLARCGGRQGVATSRALRGESHRVQGSGRAHRRGGAASRARRHVRASHHRRGSGGAASSRARYAARTRERSRGLRSSPSTSCPRNSARRP